LHVALLAAGVGEGDFFAKICPPLPGNFEIPAGELSVFGDRLGGFRGYTRQHWGEREWRLHRWA
jgi:hypothetical protein